MEHIPNSNSSESLGISNRRHKKDIAQRMASDKNITLRGLLIKPNDTGGDDDVENTPIIFGKSLPGKKPGANLLDYYGAFLRLGVVRSVMIELC